LLVIDLNTINWELGRPDRRTLALAQALGIDLDPDSKLCGQPPVLGRLPDGRLILVDGRRAAVEEGVGHGIGWLDREDMEALGVAVGTLNDTGERWAAGRLKRLLVRATTSLATVEPPRDPTGVDP
jgi:hypothetical protein